MLRIKGFIKYTSLSTDWKLNIVSTLLWYEDITSVYDDKQFSEWLKWKLEIVKNTTIHTFIQNWCKFSFETILLNF